MKSTQNRTRRRVLKLTGAVAIGTALAGCSGSSDDGSDGDDGGSDGDGGDDGGSGNSEIDDWMGDANNYDGVEDVTGEDEVTVDVGVGSNNYAYGPAAIEIDAGTTVVWEWTGDGGGHDVVAEDGAFESDLYTDEGDTFEHEFGETGTFLYKCTPHEGQGMKGVVDVV